MKDEILTLLVDFCREVEEQEPSPEVQKLIKDLLTLNHKCILSKHLCLLVSALEGLIETDLVDVVRVGRSTDFRGYAITVFFRDYEDALGIEAPFHTEANKKDVMSMDDILDFFQQVHLFHVIGMPNFSKKGGNHATNE